jgi:hypothetical protein
MHAGNRPTDSADQLIKLAQRDAARLRADFGVDLVAIFIDTMGLAAAYENEDRASQITKVVSGLDKVSIETGALVINVDHFGKDQTVGLRGSSGKRDAVETILALMVDRDDAGVASNHRMVFHKIRDGEEGRIIPYKLDTVTWGVNEDGDRVETCRVMWEPGRPVTAAAGGKRGGRGGRPRSDAGEFMTALTTMLAENGETIQPKDAAPVRAVARDVVRARFVELYPGTPRPSGRNGVVN